MERLRMQVIADEVRLETDRGWRDVQPNRILLSGPDRAGNRRIQGLGTVWPPDGEIADEAEVRPVFDADAFNPDLVAAWIRFWDDRSRKGRGIRGRLSKRVIDLRWPDWQRVHRDDRERALRAVSAFDVIVNGTPRILRRSRWPFSDALTFVP